MNLLTLILILFIHWVADFILQTHEQAINKSKSVYFLISHTIEYSLAWSFGVFLLFLINNEFEAIDQYIISTGIFTLVTFTTHTGIDYITSKINSKLWGKGKVHDFFVNVGFDQFLHYIQLFLTYKLLTN